MSNSLGKLATMFTKLAAGGLRESLRPALNLIGQNVAEEARHEIGVYQQGIGGYPATAQLSAATIDIKLRDGLGLNGDPDTPLYATGAFHDDIGFAIDINTLSVEVGTNQEHVIYTELGTRDQPPRPLFGPAALRVLPGMLPLLAQYAGMGIIAGAWKGLGAEAITMVGATETAHLIP